MPVITEIEDLRRMARRRVPRMFFEYADSGSWTEATLRANREDLAALTLRQRVLVDLARRSLATTLAGQAVSMPVALAPVGMCGMQHADGEIAAARAAERCGVPFTLSTLSICSIEDVAAHTRQPFWFQLYVMRDRDFVGRLIDRARDAGCSALVLTADLQIMGQRHRDHKNGLSAPVQLFKPATLWQLVQRPRWCLQMLGTRRHTFGNVVGHVDGLRSLDSFSAWIQAQFDPSLTWADVDWIRQRWGGKLVIKGIMEVEDARLAVQHGADAIVVSNHGGRQLDGAPSSAAVLSAIADELGTKTEVWMDSGIRSGQDVLKAVALGARGVMIGRSYLYGLGALGEEGVVKALEIIRNELDLTMAFCGRTDIRDVDRSILR